MGVGEAGAAIGLGVATGVLVDKTAVGDTTAATTAVDSSVGNGVGAASPCWHAARSNSGKKKTA